MKVLHLPTSVGGNSWGLAQGERELGFDSKVLIVDQNWLNYPSDYNLNLQEERFFKRCVALCKCFSKIKHQYDIYHFNYGSTLLDFQKLGLLLLELPFYPKDKKIIFTYNGSDARGVHPLEYWRELPTPKQSLYQKIALKVKRVKVKKASRYADHIFALNPDLLHYLPKSATFLPYTIANWDAIESCKYSIDNKIKIIHSPTSRELKGSKYIIEALHNLQKKYSNLDVQIIENIPHSKAVELYKEAHIVIDQVLIGWYGAFAVEVMKMGKPLAVYINDKDLKFIPQEMSKDLKKSIIHITPFNIEDVLRKYLDNTDLLYKKSACGAAYVQKWHDPSYVASLTKEVYERV